MLKQVMIIILSASLVLCSSLIVLAKDKTVYIEYSREEGKDDFYPKVGFDWRINYNWGFAANHQFKVDEVSEGKTYFEIRRSFLDRQLTLALNAEISESYDSLGGSVNLSSPMNDRLWYNGTVSYTSFFARSNNPGNLDYGSLKVFSEFRFTIHDKLSMLINGEWRTYDYVVRDTGLGPNPDYSEFQSAAGLVYHVNENFYAQGVYSWKDTNYEDPGLDKFGRGVIFSAYYTFKDYTYYLVYPFSQNDRTAVIGVAYNF